MAAKRLAAMFENKEAEAKDYNARNVVKNSAASKPVVLKEKQPQNGASNSPYFQRMMKQQQKKEEQEAKFQPQHKPDTNNSNPSNDSSSSTANNGGTQLNDISYSNNTNESKPNPLQSRILMFSNANHGLPTAQNITKKDNAPKTSYQSGNDSMRICVLLYIIKKDIIWSKLKYYGQKYLIMTIYVVWIHIHSTSNIL